jgi:hypothetical protein
MTDQPGTFTRAEVTGRGFEARCIPDDSVEYLWHRDCGLKADRKTGVRTLIVDPAAVPDGPWRATELGRRELEDPTLLDPHTH